MDVPVDQFDGRVGRPAAGRIGPVGRERHRHVEREATVDQRPAQGDGTTQQAAGGLEVPRRDGGADLGAADGLPVERERRRHDDIEPVALAEGGQRLGRAPPLEAERGVRGHQEAGELDARTDPLDELAVRGPTQRFVEVLDDGHRHAGRFEAHEPLVGVDEEWRRSPGQDLVRVVVEGDDGRLCATGRRLVDQPMEQIEMAEVEPIEHADDDEGRTQVSVEGFDARDDAHRSRSGGVAAAAAGLTKTLSGASRLPPLGDAIATSVPSGPRSR